MAFFDNFGKKVTQMSQDAVAKAKNMTDQAKLHSQISEEEKKISGNYCKIGELFYGVRGEQDLPEYQTLMDQIDASKERIAELNHQLQIAKGMVVCPECGAEVSINAAFCPNCGSRMPQAEPEQTPQEDAETADEEEMESQEECADPADTEAEPQEECADPADTEAEPQEECADPADTEAEPQEECADPVDTEA